METIGDNFDFNVAPTQIIDSSAEEEFEAQPSIDNDEQLLEKEFQR